MSYLSAATHQDIIANPAHVQEYYDQIWQSFRTSLGSVDAISDIPNGLLATAFAAIVAWDLKPYGTEPTVLDLQTLLNAPSLACNDYVSLTWYFCDDFMPQTASIKKVAIGWNGGAVGNHAQMLAEDPATGISLLLDPTIGLVARGVTYDSLTKGLATPASMLASFENFNTYPGSTGTFTQTVKNAVINGLYKPSDALYYVDKLSIFNALPAEASWLTPQGVALTG